MDDGIGKSLLGRNPGRIHLVVQPSSPDELRELEARGARILEYIPENAWSVSIPVELDIDTAAPAARWLAAESKLSPLVSASIAEDQAGYFVVVFHPDVDLNEGRALALEQELAIVENPDLVGNQLLVAGPVQRVARLAEWDEVSYAFPASQDLVEARPVVGCTGASTAQGPVGQYVARVGEGWDGAGLGGAQLNYVLERLPGRLPADQVRVEIARALAEWARHAKLTFTLSSDPRAARTLALLWASGAHGDPYPFDGPGKVLAHTFYPAPPNPEPIAGDLHFDDDESWRIGADTDLYSVVLHELGHALGLGHSDQPGAVMYPYYRRATSLTQEDISAILTLYAKQDATGGTTPTSPTTPTTPLAVAITSPASATVTTSSTTLAAAGSVTGGSDPVQVTWASNRGPAGVAAGSRLWSVAALPLSAGTNVFTITATDARQVRATRTLTVEQQAASARDTTPPAIAVTNPASSTVLTTGATITMRGTASDNVGVARVEWSNSGGSSGIATGTTSWEISSVPLIKGYNSIMVKARDAAGNSTWRTIQVTRR